MLSPAGSALRLTLSRARAPGHGAALASLISHRPNGAARIHSGAAVPGRRMSTVVEDRVLENAHVPPPPPRPQRPAADSTGAAERPNSDVLKRAVKATGLRNDWTKQEIAAIYNHPLMDLAFQAASPPPPLPPFPPPRTPDEPRQTWEEPKADLAPLQHQGTVHRRFHNPAEVQLCTLMNIKTGGCSEDCSYCAQSTRYQTGVKAQRVEPVEAVLEAARTAKANGSTRFCMGAAWRDMRGRKNSLKNIKAMVEGVRALDMEVCVTLGMIDDQQARELKEAGLTAYNHNVDTSREFYPSVITTRTYDERLRTLSHVRDAGLNVCSGGILGLGEKAEDHIGLLHTVSTLPSHPESFPVNALVPIKGTPLGDKNPIEFTAVLRTVATARLLMPATIIRIAAGRKTMSEEKQALCFMAGANAIFTGEKMLTTECNGWDEDGEMFKRWGLVPMRSFDKSPRPQPELQ